MSEIPQTICLVACAKAKLERAAPARQMYVSQLFCAARSYAERRADAWFILSAKYGLVEPQARIEPYNTTLNKLKKTTRERWAARVVEALAGRVRAGDLIIFIAGKKYRELIVPALIERRCRVDVPLEGLGIGRQLQSLKRMNAQR